MEDYPVFRPEKYSALGFSQVGPYSPDGKFTESQTYHSNYRTQAGSSQWQASSFNQSRSRSPSYVQQRPEAIRRQQQRLKNEVIKGDSRIEYVPVQKKAVDYVEEVRYSLVPKKRKITQYKDFVRVEFVPREVTVTDHYAVEHIRSYVPQVVPESAIEYVPVERRNVKYEYIPVERQLVHYPERILEQEEGRFLGRKEVRGSTLYDNVRQSDIQFWEREYGYIRGEPVEVLNRKIRDKVERDKQEYFRKFEREYENAPMPPTR